MTTQVAWEIFTPLLHRIDAGKIPLLPYKQGSRGPREADELNAQTGYVRSEGYIWKFPTNYATAVVTSCVRVVACP